MKKRLQLIMSVVFIVLAGLNGYGQNAGDEFTVGDPQYKITSISPNVVQVLDYTGTGGAVTIPNSLTSLGHRAFAPKQLAFPVT